MGSKWLRHGNSSQTAVTVEESAKGKDDSNPIIVAGKGHDHDKSGIVVAELDK